MPALDHNKAHAAADKQLIGDEANKILAMKSAGCHILNEINGMSDDDILAVFQAAKAKQNADSTSPPSITLSADPYRVRMSGYGYVPDSSAPRLRASVEAFVPGKGPQNIMTFDSDHTEPNATMKNGTKLPGTCKDLP